MKVKCEIRISGVVDIPDCWNDPKHTKDNPYYPLNVADYKYNDSMEVEDALKELLPQMVCGDDTDIEISFSEDET